MSENGTEIAALKKRIEDLELAMKMLRNMNINLLTIAKEYGRGIAEVYEKIMGAKEADAAAAEFAKRFNFKAEPDAPSGG